MSEPTDTPSAPPPSDEPKPESAESPPAEAEAPVALSPNAAASAAALAAAEGSGAGEGTPFALARKLVAEKVPRDEALKRLRESGVDEESAKLALNAVNGPNPTDLPDATLAPGINPLAPGSFALSDIGMSGNPAVVALYWMAFGAVVLVLVAIFLVLPEFGVGEPSEVSSFWARVGLGLGGGAFGWGAVKLALTVRVRRRPD